MRLPDVRNNEIPKEIHRTVAEAVREGSAFDSVAVSLQNSEIIARKFGIINKCIFGSEGKKGVPGQIFSPNGQSVMAVLNLGIFSDGKSCGEILGIIG